MKIVTNNNRIQEIFDAIPTDVWLKIFSYLDLESRCKSGRVCKFWKSIVDTRKFWEENCEVEKINVPENSDPKVVFIKAFQQEMEKRINERLKSMKEDAASGKINPILPLLFSSPGWSGH